MTMALKRFQTASDGLDRSRMITAHSHRLEDVALGAILTGLRGRDTGRRGWRLANRCRPSGPDGPRPALKRSLRHDAHRRTEQPRGGGWPPAHGFRALLRR